MRKRLIINAAGRRDPTRTTGIRAAFVRDVRRRWAKLKSDITKSIVDQDCFGIQTGVITVHSPTGSKAFDFARTEAKIAGFMKWLKQQEDQGILELVSRPGARLSAEEAWSNIYIRSAYQMGIARARTELKKKGYPVAGIQSAPGGIAGAMNAGFHADRVGLIYTRTYEDLKTVAEATNARIRRALSDGLTNQLAQGMAEGLNPKTIARNILKNVNYAVDHVGKTRATLIARTEVIKAHTEATLIEYRQAAGDIQVEVQAEVSTAGDDRVCDLCDSLALGGPYTLEQAAGLIPAHPQCRCAFLPVIMRQPAMAVRQEELRMAA